MTRVLASLLAAILTVFAITLIKGDGPGSGRVIWAPSASYGVNAGDIPIALLWILGLACCAVLFFKK